MATGIDQEKYYDNYWTTGISQHSGENTGYAPNLKRWMDRELKEIPAQSKILEVGCGDASFTKNLVQYSSQVTAIDISSAQLDRNSETLPEVNFVQHDLSYSFPFKDNTFNVIWCSEVLEHLFSPNFALKEMFRVLCPQGRIMVTVPYHGLVKNLAIALFKWDHHFDPEYPHIRFFTKKTLSNLVKKAGFEEIEMSTCGMSRPLRDLLIPTNLLLKAKKV